MSNDVVLFPGNLPDYLRDGAAMDATTKALVGGGGGKRISIKGSVFRLVVDGQQIAEKEERFMDVVVVAAAPAVNRTYYEGAYQEGVVASPDCYSQDGVFPATDSKSIQSKSCATCPQNVAGSGQGQSRACRYSQRIAVVLDNDMEGDVFQLTLPAQSIFGKPEGSKMPLQAYAKHLAAHNVPITAVVTEMRFDTSSATPKLTFKPKRPLTKDEFDIAKSQGATMEAQAAITLTVSQMDKAEEKEAARAAKPAQRAPKQEVFEQEAEATTVAESAEPTVRKGKAKADEIAEKMGGAKLNLQETLAQWDDED